MLYKLYLQMYIKNTVIYTDIGITILDTFLRVQ